MDNASIILKFMENSKKPLELKNQDKILICDNLINGLPFNNLGYTVLYMDLRENESNIEDIRQLIKETKKYIYTYFDIEYNAYEFKEEYPNIIDYSELKNISELKPDELEEKLNKIQHDILRLEGINNIRPHNTLKYIENKYYKDLSAYNEKSININFNVLNNHLDGIHNGLYIIGGGSSVGKTTFCHQIADQLAEQGHNILYFSLEQSTMELITKSITRIRACKFKESEKIDNKKIKKGDNSEGTQKAIDYYKNNIGRNFSIIEGNFNCTVGYIKRYIGEYMLNNSNIKPIVFIDYLQVITPPDNAKTKDLRGIIDFNLTELKRITRLYNIPIIWISSFNRGNYYNRVSFESFKESGGIEYTADVVLGLQLSIIESKDFDLLKSINEKREETRKAKKGDIKGKREITLIGLKNRFNYCNFKCDFNYFPQYDLFSEGKESKEEPPKEFNSILDELR